MQRCSGAAVHVKVKVKEVQGQVQVQRCRGAEVHRCTGAQVQIKSRYICADAESRWRGTEVRGERCM
jgi:hypothetical protein